MKICQIATGIWAFMCPGCGHWHQYWTSEARTENGLPYESQWTFNSNRECPSFQPSLLNRWGKEADPNWQEPADAPPGNKWSGRCHLFVTNGMIQYCSDCTHELAGQTVPLPELEESFTSQYQHLNQ